MYICKLTKGSKGETTLRLPKALVYALDLKSDFVILHRVKKMVVIESAGQRLSKLKECRLLSRKRLSEYGKAT